MNERALLAAALAALLVTSGCTALGGGDGSGPAAEEFPNASEIDESTLDRHAALLANTSFTVEFEQDVYEFDPYGAVAWESDNVTTWNGTRRVQADPSAREYRWHSNGTWPFLGQVANGTAYATASAVCSATGTRTAP